MTPAVDDLSKIGSIVSIEVYNIAFEIVYCKGNISESDIVKQLLKITSLNFSINHVKSEMYMYICSSMRDCDGLLSGYIVTKIGDKDNELIYKTLISLLSNQTSLLMQNDRIKKNLGVQNTDYSKILDVSLTTKETEVFSNLVYGKSDIEIASVMIISKSTLRMHLKNIFEKTHSSSRSEVISKFFMGCIEIENNNIEMVVNKSIG